MKISIIGAIAFLMLSLFCVGCASTDGGEVVGGVLQGIGVGLSGL